MTPGSPTKGAPSDRQKQLQEQRREFMAKALAAAGGATAFLGATTAGAAVIPREEVQIPADSQLERMMAELRLALQRPVDKRRWMMVIDLRKCIGCHACTISCEAENNLPPEVVYRPVLAEEIGTYPDVRKVFTPQPCMHCEKPPCVPVCPADATHKRPDGIVDTDYDKCIGCGNCVEACPYEHRVADDGDFFGEDTPAVTAYETRPNFEYGQEWSRTPGDYETPPISKVRKCHYCLHRIENGMLPACVTTCLGGATYFGDYNLKTSFVRELVGATRTMRLHEEWGTAPTTTYLV